MSSVRSVAKRAGVSIATVSRVLNNDPAVSAEARARVLAEVNRSRYVPAVGRRNTMQIALAYTQEMTVGDPFDAAVLEGIVRGLEDSEYDVAILRLERDKSSSETYTHFFLRKGVRGVILRTTEATRDVCRQIAEEGFPHVVISERFDEPYVNYIDCNSRPDSERAVEYLISLGHRRIALGVHTVADRDHLDRIEGYRAALEKNGLPCDERLVFRHPFTLAGGASALRMAMTMRPRPTAIYFADPMMAVGAVCDAHRMGVRIPQDISIIGFDDTQVRFGVYPTLTAVCQDASALGYEAARWLSAALSHEGPEEPLRRTLPTFFEVNHSTAPPCGGDGTAVVSDGQGAQGA